MKNQVELAKLENLARSYKEMFDIFPDKLVNVRLFDQWSLKDLIAHLNHWIDHDVGCLQRLKKGDEPVWEEDVDDFNRKGVGLRKKSSWQEVRSEFLKTVHLLIKHYRSLPDDLWHTKIWPDRDHTPAIFVQDDIDHWMEHLEEIIEKAKTKQSSAVWVRNSMGEVALQLRSADDDRYPLHWDVSAAGGIKAGESPQDAAMRELKEELGIEAKVEFIEEFLYEGEGGADYLFIFQSVHDGSFAPDPLEVEKVELFTPELINQMIQNGEKFHPEFRELWEVCNL